MAGVSTNMKWMAEAQTLGLMVKTRQGPRYLNGSQSLPIPGISQVSLEQLLEGLPPQDLGARVAGALQGIRRPDYQVKVDLLLKRLRESFERCLTLADEMTVELKKIEQEVVRGSLKLAGEMLRSSRREKGAGLGQVPPHLASGKLALCQVELEEELAYRVVLEEMIKARSVYLQRVYDEFTSVAKGTPQLLWQRQVTLEQEKVQFIKTAAAGQLVLLSP